MFGTSTGIVDARVLRDVAIDLGGVGHLRHPLRADERARLDHAQPGVGERGDVVDLRLGRNA